MTHQPLVVHQININQAIVAMIALQVAQAVLLQATAQAALADIINQAEVA